MNYLLYTRSVPNAEKGEGARQRGPKILKFCGRHVWMISHQSQLEPIQDWIHEKHENKKVGYNSVAKTLPVLILITLPSRQQIRLISDIGSVL